MSHHQWLRYVLRLFAFGICIYLVGLLILLRSRSLAQTGLAAESATGSQFLPFVVHLTGTPPPQPTHTPTSTGTATSTLTPSATPTLTPSPTPTFLSQQKSIDDSKNTLDRFLVHFIIQKIMNFVLPLSSALNAQTSG